MRIDIKDAETDLLDLKILNEVQKGGATAYKLSLTFQKQHDDTTVYRRVKGLTSRGYVAFKDDGTLELTASGRSFFAGILDRWIPTISIQPVPPGAPGSIEGFAVVSAGGTTDLVGLVARRGTVEGVVKVGSIQTGELLTGTANSG